MVKENRGTLTVPHTKRRKLVSKVWEHFTKFEENALQWAECKYCNKKFTGSSKSGTTHLKNHLERCPIKKIKFPTQISSDLTSPGANEGNSIFDPERTRLEFATTIIKNQCLLDVVEDECYKNFLRTLQPMFELQSRESILSDIDRIYKEEKKKLRQYFDQLGCNYSLAIRFGEDNLKKNVYCCLVAYFINDDWELKKNIIAFKLLDRVYDSQTVSGIIRSSLLEWNISKKICSITVNSLGLSDDIVEQIKENCLPAVGQASLPSGGCYNSCTLIEDGLHEIDDLLLKIRKLIEYVSEKPSERLKFQDAVNQLKLLGGKSRDDCPLRLDSGFEMLDWALESREVFFQVEQSDDNFGIILSKEEWDKALLMHSCLKESLSCFGGIEQSLTANVYFPKLCGMYRKFLQLEKTNYPCMKLMKMKFDNYWTTHHLVFAIATVLDPRLKFKFVEVMYGEIYGRNSKMELNKFHKLLMDVYDNYANELDNQISPTAIFGDSSCSTTQSADDSILKSFWRYASKKKLDDVASWKSELDCYLEEPLLVPLDNNDEFFDILDWWRSNTLKFPRLGRMARDILAIRVSTAPPHSSFSTLITNPKNSDLGPEIIEAFVCGQDWLETPQTDNKSNHANVQIMPDDKATWRKTEPRPWSEEDIRAYLVSPFTPDEEKQIRRWESSGLSGDSVVREKMINVEPLLIIPHDKEFRHKYYIDDSVVNEFFELLKRRTERFPDMYVKHYSFDSSIARLIKESKTDSVLLDKLKSSVEKKQDKIVELKDAEKLFLPLCFLSHWILFYVDTKKQKLVWLDSYRSSVQMFTKDVEDKISRWFKGSLLPFLGYENANEWQFQVPTDIPMQENQVDCALFVMKYADCLTHGDCFPFSPKDMAHFRHRTLLDIYEGSLFQPEFRAKQTVK
ncbi:hypothetical protein QUC31_017397 [Theobroma cacao]